MAANESFAFTQTWILSRYSKYNIAQNKNEWKVRNYKTSNRFQKLNENIKNGLCKFKFILEHFCLLNN